MPVIEEAKGHHRGPVTVREAEASGMLRRVFQRSNVPVRGLAAQVVAKATGWATGLGTVTCSRPCA